MKSKIHTPERILCDLCNETFCSLNRLESFIRLIHNNKNGVKCPNCKKSLANRNNLISHLKHSFPNIIKEEMKCEICMKVVRGKMNLINHITYWHKRGKKKNIWKEE